MGSWGSEAPNLFQLPGAQFKGDSPFPPQNSLWDYEDEEPRTPKVRGLVFHNLPGVGGQGEQSL